MAESNRIESAVWTMKTNYRRYRCVRTYVRARVKKVQVQKRKRKEDSSRQGLDTRGRKRNGVPLPLIPPCSARSPIRGEK